MSGDRARASHRYRVADRGRAPDVSTGRPRRGSDLTAQVLALQRAHGNRATGELLRAAPSDQVQRLEPSARAAMEARLGGDLGDVRIHTGHAAATEARGLGAVAFTRGSDVYLDASRDLSGAAGEKVLAHELVHARQQTPGDARSRGEPSLEAEARATRNAHPVSVEPGTAARGMPQRADEEEWHRLRLDESRSSLNGHRLARTAPAGQAQPVNRRRDDAPSPFEPSVRADVSQAARPWTAGALRVYVEGVGEVPIESLEQMLAAKSAATRAATIERLGLPPEPLPPLPVPAPPLPRRTDDGRFHVAGVGEVDLNDLPAAVKAQTDLYMSIARGEPVAAKRIGRTSDLHAPLGALVEDPVSWDVEDVGEADYHQLWDALDERGRVGRQPLPPMELVLLRTVLGMGLDLFGIFSAMGAGRQGEPPSPLTLLDRVLPYETPWQARAGMQMEEAYRLMLYLMLDPAVVGAPAATAAEGTLLGERLLLASAKPRGVSQLVEMSLRLAPVEDLPTLLASGASRLSTAATSGGLGSGVRGSSMVPKLRLARSASGTGLGAESATEQTLLMAPKSSPGVVSQGTRAGADLEIPLKPFSRRPFSAEPLPRLPGEPGSGAGAEALPGLQRPAPSSVARPTGAPPNPAVTASPRASAVTSDTTALLASIARLSTLAAAEPRIAIGTEPTQPNKQIFPGVEGEMPRIAPSLPGGLPISDPQTFPDRIDEKETPLPAGDPTKPDSAPLEAADRRPPQPAPPSRPAAPVRETDEVIDRELVPRRGHDPRWKKIEQGTDPLQNYITVRDAAERSSGLRPELFGAASERVPHVVDKVMESNKHVAGRHNGWQSPDATAQWPEGTAGWRLDFDSKSSKRVHINWWRIEGGVRYHGSITIRGGDESDYLYLLDRHFDASTSPSRRGALNPRP